MNINDEFHWNIFANVKNKIPLIDLSNYDKNIQNKIVNEIVEVFLGTSFDKQDLLMYSPFLVKYTNQLFELNIIASHLIVDATSRIIFNNQLVNYYQLLKDKKNIDNSNIKPYKSCIQIINNKDSISPKEFLSEFQIDDFIDYSKILKRNSTSGIFKNEGNLNSTISYKIDCTLIDQKNIWAVSFLLYCKLLSSIFKTEKLSTFIVSLGREYNNNVFFDTISEFIDFIPFAVDTSLYEPSQIIDLAYSKIEYAKKNSINIINTLTNKSGDDSNWEIINNHSREIFETNNIFSNLFNFTGKYDHEVLNKIVQSEDLVVKQNANIINTFFEASIAYSNEILYFRVSTPFGIDKCIVDQLFTDDSIKNINNSIK